MLTPPNMSRVTCHVSLVTCHKSHVFFLFFFYLIKCRSLSMEGLLSMGPTPSSFRKAPATPGLLNMLTSPKPCITIVSVILFQWCHLKWRFFFFHGNQWLLVQKQTRKCNFSGQWNCIVKVHTGISSYNYFVMV